MNKEDFSSYLKDWPNGSGNLLSLRDRYPYASLLQTLSLHNSSTEIEINRAALYKKDPILFAKYIKRSARIIEVRTDFAAEESIEEHIELDNTTSTPIEFVKLPDANMADEKEVEKIEEVEARSEEVEVRAEVLEEEVEGLVETNRDQDIIEEILASFSVIPTPSMEATNIIIEPAGIERETNHQEEEKEEQEEIHEIEELEPLDKIEYVEENNEVELMEEAQAAINEVPSFESEAEIRVESVSNTDEVLEGEKQEDILAIINELPEENPIKKKSIFQAHIPDEPVNIKQEQPKDLMVMMSFMDWLLYFKSKNENEAEDNKGKKAIRAAWQMEKLAEAMDDDEDEIPEEIFKQAMNSISFSPALVSEPLAELFAKQGKIEKAIEMYKKLSLQNPEKRAYFATKIKELHLSN